MANRVSSSAVGLLSPKASVPIWDMDALQLAQWARLLPSLSKEPLFSSKLLPNLLSGVNSILPKKPATESPPKKRLKLENGGAEAKSSPPEDPHRIWVDQHEGNEVPDTVGGIVVQLTHQGLLNALTLGSTEFDAKQVNDVATILHRAIQAKMEGDFLDTTPDRIRLMLCADVPPPEFRAIRKRVYDTVVLGKGMNNAQVEEEDLPVAARAAVHDVEKFKKCKVCGNNDQSLFVLDRKNGDVICTSCGTICMESLMHEGSQYRKFEGEVDRNHHGDAANKLYSNAHNLATTLGGVQVASSVNQAFGTHTKGMETVLRNAHAYTELNLSQFGKQGERKTRIGYKDKQKRDAFSQMTHVGDALNLHEAVVQRAKELFAGFRDDRELVQQFKGVIAACLCEAFDQLSRDGHRILKLREQDTKIVGENSARANRRNELHHASMAGKGGLLLDFSHVPTENGKTSTKEMASSSPKVVSAIEQKPASKWDLDDCRSWLLEAARSIAQQWITDRAAGAKNIPEGSQEELEGKLVEHTINLCDQLEAELNARDRDKGGKKVVTPRVQDMAQLGIKWQHAHERGSGGKGGVGNSGRAVSVKKPGERSGRTAGQILILKTSKKLGSMLGDPVAGEAFHKELRALVGRQEARKRKDRADEAARQRFHQMQRKPWLKARAQESG